TELAAEQVERLDSVRSLVDRSDPAVAQQLLHRVFLDVAITAVDLDSEVADLQGALGAVSLGDGNQEVDDSLEPLLLLGIRRGPDGVGQEADVVAKAADAFHIDLH